MKLSHSKLNCILNNPAEYYLIYKEGIKLKDEKPALSLGSAVHWGIEHNTEDLTEYYDELKKERGSGVYSEGQPLAEAMVHGYLKNKEAIFTEILKDENGNKIKLLDETHELTLTAPLISRRTGLQHDFLGIIDLLLTTEKGFIIIDYKTSSRDPDWDKYLEQIYRYIFLMNHNFKDIPIYKIGIINLKKTMIRKKKNENEIDFKARMIMEYDINDENYINYHEYLPSEFDKAKINEYIDNLRDEGDAAQLIEDKSMYFINYSNIEGVYGKSDYYDIYKNVEDCYVKYEISDERYILDSGKVESITRDCKEIDMQVLRNKNVVNKYHKFKDIINKIFKNKSDILFYKKDEILDMIASKYTCDRELLETYYEDYILENL